MFKNIFLSRLSAKRPEPVRQGITIFVISCFFLNALVFACGSEVLAAQGVELKDEEMDNVYAEGFTFSFDISMPNTQNLINNAIDSTKAASANTFAVIPAGGQSMNTLLVSDCSQQFLSSLVNINAAGSSVPVQFNLSVNVNSNIGNIYNNNLMNVANYYNYIYNVMPTAAAIQPVAAIQPAVVTPAVVTPAVVTPAVVAPTVSVVNTVSSEPAVNVVQPAVVVPALTSVNTASSEPAVNTVQPVVVVPALTSVNTASSEPAVNAVQPAVVIAPAVVVPTVTAVNTSSSEPAVNTVQPAVVVPAITSVNTVSSEPAVNVVQPAVVVPAITSVNTISSEPVVNTVQPAVITPAVVTPAVVVPSVPAQNNAQAVPQVSGGSQQQTTTLAPVTTPGVTTTAVGNLGGMNAVIIGNNSQQYLSSLVNVNAAGSIVPVLLNLVININSNVNQVSNNNNLDFSSYSRFQIR